MKKTIFFLLINCIALLSVAQTPKPAPKPVPDPRIYQIPSKQWIYQPSIQEPIIQTPIIQTPRLTWNGPLRATTSQTLGRSRSTSSPWRRILPPLAWARRSSRRSLMSPRGARRTRAWSMTWPGSLAS